MKPENVNPANFSIINILFDNNKFSIAYGIWDNSNKCIAMRWNGEENDPGYPKVFGHPMWFIIDNDLRLPIIQSLLGIEGSNKDNLLKTLNEII